MQHVDSGIQVTSNNLRPLHGSVTFCGKCGQAGHNKRSCKNEEVTAADKARIKEDYMKDVQPRELLQDIAQGALGRRVGALRRREALSQSLRLHLMRRMGALKGRMSDPQ